MLDLNQEQIEAIEAEAARINAFFSGRKRQDRMRATRIPSKRRKRAPRYDFVCKTCRLYFSTKDINRSECRKCDPEVVKPLPIVTRQGLPLLSDRPPEWWAVYALLDPRSRAVRYVGFSRRPADRLYEHCHSMLRSTRAWIQELKLLHVAPVMEILETGEGLHAGFQAEAQWIKQFKDLLNVIHNTGPNVVAPRTIAR